MAFVVVRNLLNASKICGNNKVLLLNTISKSLSRFDVKNTRTLSRSLFLLSKNRDSNISNISANTLSNKCSCGCSFHTKGDKELAAFLAEEIENEKRAQARDPTRSDELPVLEGFEYECNEAEIIFRKQLENENITIKANVNNSVDAEEPVMDPNETKEPEAAEMKAKPEFTIEIQKGTKTLSFLCTYSEDMPEEVPTEEYNDFFQISEISLYEGEFKDTTYTVCGDIMDGYLYDLLMNYLEERGISNQFAEKMVMIFTSYEHKLYINLLTRMKSFVEKK